MAAQLKSNYTRASTIYWLNIILIDDINNGGHTTQQSYNNRRFGKIELKHTRYWQSLRKICDTRMQMHIKSYALFIKSCISYNFTRA